MSRSNYMTGTKIACRGNTNGYIYALVRVPKKDAKESLSAELLTYSEDKEYYLNNDAVKYIGTTNNPIARLQAHGSSKGRKMGMVIFDDADTPAEGKFKEAQAIYKYCDAKGQGPEWQKGHDTWAGA